MARCWLLPVAFTFSAAALKELFHDDSLMHLGLLSGCYVVLFLAVCRIVGMNRGLIRAELIQARALFSGNK
jgi:hypothetical protein